MLGLIAAMLAADLSAAETKTLAAAGADRPKGPPALLLADVWTPSVDPTGWWMSEKYDGLRGYWDGRKLWSRKGTAIQAPAYFLAELPAEIALDGELWIGRGQFEETTGAVMSQTPDDRWKRMHFMVFDAPQAKGTFEQRMAFLQDTVPKENQFVKVVAQSRCKGTAHLLAERDRVVADGAEGLMLRKPESEYEVGRSPTLLKVKPYDDAEAAVIGHLPGKGKYAGKLGALRVATSEGLEFSLGSGFTNAQRESPPAVGTIVTYRFRGLTAKGLPRFPSFLRIRRE
jgi:DNA ligase